MKVSSTGGLRWPKLKPSQILSDKKDDLILISPSLMLSFSHPNYDEENQSKVKSHNGVGECGRKILQQQLVLCQWLPLSPTLPNSHTHLPHLPSATHRLPNDTHIQYRPSVQLHFAQRTNHYQLLRGDFHFLAEGFSLLGRGLNSGVR